LGGQVGFAWQHVRFTRLKQHVVEGQAKGDIDMRHEYVLF